MKSFYSCRKVSLLTTVSNEHKSQLELENAFLHWKILLFCVMA